MGHAHHDKVIALLMRQLGDAGRGVHRVVAADIEEIADIVAAQHVHDALEIFLLVFLELIAAGSDKPGARGVPQQLQFLFVLRVHVDELLKQHDLDAVPRRVYFADAVGILPAGLDHTQKR